MTGADKGLQGVKRGDRGDKGLQGGYEGLQGIYFHDLTHGNTEVPRSDRG